MNRIAIAFALGLVSLAPACSKKAPPAETTKPPETKAAEDTAKAPAPDAAKPPEADAAKASAPDAAPPAGDVGAAKVAITGEARVTKYLACWDAFNNRKMDEFKACFAPDFTDEAVDTGMPATKGWDDFKAQRVDWYMGAFPDLTGKAQMIYQVGEHTIGVVLLTGTNKGPMKGPSGEIPATGKKFGMLVLHDVTWQKDGELAAGQRFLMDQATMMAQLGLSKAPARPVMESGVAEPAVTIAKGDDAEAKLLANWRKELADFNKRDFAAAFGNLADNAVWHEQPLPADQDKKAAMTEYQGMVGAFSDLAVNEDWGVAAGNTVIGAGHFTGTNDGDIKAMGVPKTGKKINVQFYEIQQYDNGKITHDWLFYNNAAFAAQLGLMGEPKKDEPPKPNK